MVPGQVTEECSKCHPFMIVKGGQRKTGSDSTAKQPTGK